MAQPDRIVVYYAGKKDGRPVYASQQAAGADLKAHIPNPIKIMPGQRVLVPTGIYLAIPEGWEGQIRPRSGLAFRHGLTLLNSPGTVDSDYRGEVKVLMVNLGQDAIEISPDERIAQLVVVPAPQVDFQYVEKFDDNIGDTIRGDGGFGSTGSK